MQRKFLRWCGGRRRYLFVVGFTLCCCTQIPAQKAPAYPVVQLDLNAGSFLDPLPLDDPFLIQGRASDDTDYILVTFEEFFGEGHFFSERPERVAAFRRGARDILDAILSDSGIAADDKIRTLERRLGNLLWQRVRPDRGLSIGDVLPWNWGHWVKAVQSKSARLLIDGVPFDSSDNSILFPEKFQALAQAVVFDAPGSKRDAAADRLVDFIVDEVQGVQVVSAPAPRHPAVRVAWRRMQMHNGASAQEEPLSEDPSSRWNRLEQRLQGSAALSLQEFRIVVPPLEADRAYLVHVYAEGRSSAAGESPPSINRYFWADTEAGDYVSLDAGLLYVREIEETSWYLGMNFYLRPVAKDVPLRTRGGVLRRFAFTVGLAVQNIEDARHTRRALFGPASGVLGAGIRISKYLRLGGGILIFRERDPETFPLTTRTSLTCSPYLSASFDMDVGKQLRGLGRLFGTSKNRVGE